MRAAVLREYGEPLAITDVPEPEPDPHGAVVAVDACGICRSDWHAWQGHGEWADDQVPTDFVLGHEPAGEVVAVGDRVDGLGVGDRVVVPFDLGCGTCRACTTGHGNTCRDGVALGFERAAPGAFAEQVHVPQAAYNALPIPDGVPARDVAALGCRFTTAYHALVGRAAFAPGDWVAVHGCGGVGLSAVHIADALGARPVAVDIDPDALDRAETAGAAATVDATETDPVAAIRSITADADGEGAHVSLDALGRAETCRNSVQCLRQRGTHVQVGLTTAAEEGAVALPVDEITRWEIDVLGSRGMPPTDYDELLGLLEAGTLDPSLLVGREVSLADVPERLAAMTDYGTDGIEVVTFE